MINMGFCLVAQPWTYKKNWWPIETAQRFSMVGPKSLRLLYDRSRIRRFLVLTS